MLTKKVILLYIKLIYRLVERINCLHKHKRSSCTVYY